MKGIQAALCVALTAVLVFGCKDSPTDTLPSQAGSSAPLFSSLPVADCPDDQALVEANGFEADDKNGDGWICISTNGAGKVRFGDNNVNSTPGERPIDRLPPQAANGVLHSCLDPDSYDLLPVQPGYSCAALCQAVQTSACSEQECLQLCEVAGGSSGITIDASSVTSQDFAVWSVGSYPTAEPVTLDLSAGNYRIQATEGAIDFSVTPEGLVAYEPSLEGMLEGAGTTALKVNGATVQMTAPQLTSMGGDYTVLKVGVFPIASVSSMNVLPGLKRIQAGEGGVNLSVTEEGNFAYDPALEGILQGAGTPLLTMNGAAVQITGPQLTTASGDYLVINNGVFPAAAVSTLHVLPGMKRITAGEGGVYVSVTEEGNFAYDPALEGILQGAGTPLLTMNGAAAQITGPQLTTASGDYLVINNGVFPAAAVSTLHVLPGMKRITAGEGGVYLSVTEEGNFAYDPALEGILQGAGTPLLTMAGAAVQITGPQLTTASGDYLVINNGVFPAAAVSTLHVLPGMKRITAGEGGVYVSVSEEGNFAYDPALEGILQGAGTPLLTMNGAVVEVNATNLTAASFQILNVGLFSTTSPVWLNFLPGNKRFRSSDIDFDFQVLSTGFVDYDSALDGLLTGRSTNILTILP